jgi:ring-1,2-phenylacetyl-CoA epoxidase subunit PaaE
MAFSFFKSKKKKESTDSRYINLTVKEVVKETADAVTLVFNQPESGNLNYKPGQFITLIIKVDGKKIRRAYSLCSSPFLNETPAVTIKKVEGGLMSNYINNKLKSGDVIEIMEPMGSFTPDINSNNKKHLYLVAGGSGITPMMSIAKSVLSEELESKVSLVYANRDENSIIFKSTIEKMEVEFADRFVVTHCFEKPINEWSGLSGYLDADKLQSSFDATQNSDYELVEYYTCGPQPLMDIVMDSCSKLGIADDKKHLESFVAGNTSPKGIIDSESSEIVTHEVTIILDGDEHKFEVKPDSTILETGLDNNIDMPYSCQSGLCTACRGKCVSGKIKMDEEDGLTEQEKAEGYVLLCVGHPLTDDVVVEIG